MLERVWLAAVIALGGSSLGCERASAQIVEAWIDRGGGTLHLRGAFAGHGAVLVSIDGVFARAVVIEGPRALTVQVPPLPRDGVVDVELCFADGHRVRLESAIEVRAPSLRR